MERVNHLEDALGGVFANINAAAENLAGGIEDDELDVVPFGDKNHAVGELTKHQFIEEIVLRAVQGHTGDTGLDAMLDKLKFFGMAALGFGPNLDRLTAWHGGILLPDEGVCPLVKAST